MNMDVFSSVFVYAFVSFFVGPYVVLKFFGISISSIQKVGFFLEFLLLDYLALTNEQANQLLPHIPKNPYYLDTRQHILGQGNYISKWQLIVPNYIVQRRWEEPYVDDV